MFKEAKNQIVLFLFFEIIKRDYYLNTHTRKLKGNMCFQIIIIIKTSLPFLYREN